MRWKIVEEKNVVKIVARSALISIQTFLLRLAFEISSVDFEVNSIIPLPHFEEIDSSLEQIKERDNGITNTPELTVVPQVNDIERSTFSGSTRSIIAQNLSLRVLWMLL